MTIEETATIMTALEAAYPQFYREKTDDEKFQAAQLWAEMFKDYDYRLVAAAVKSFIATDTKGYPPAIGLIMDKVVSIVHPDTGMTEMEAWSLISRAAAHSGYNSQEEFDRLPETLQRVVGSSNTLREWGMMPSEQFQTVVQSNFMRSYRARVKNDREYQSMPLDIRKFFSNVMQMSDNLMIEEKQKGDTK